jgi:prophage regulatory protein
VAPLSIDYAGFTGFMREPAVLKLVPVAHSTLWMWTRKGLFPRPVKLGPRMVAWRVSDVQAWLDAQTVGGVEPE